MRDITVYTQMVTMIILAGMFWCGGLHRLAVAQACYVVATGVIFVGVK